MEAIVKVAALENTLASPSKVIGPAAPNSVKTDPEDLVNRFEMLMRGRAGQEASPAAPLEPSAIASAIGNLADDSTSVAEETDAVFDNEDMSASEVSLRMSVLSQEMRLVGLQLKAYSEMSKQSREGVQTLIRG
jgi:hypothetical protein